jgi:hypothetical protein
MSAFAVAIGGKADIAAAHMSAFDPKRTSAGPTSDASNVLV